MDRALLQYSRPIFAHGLETIREWKEEKSYKSIWLIRIAISVSRVANISLGRKKILSQVTNTLAINFILFLIKFPPSFRCLWGLGQFQLIVCKHLLHKLSILTRYNQHWEWVFSVNLNGKHSFPDGLDLICLNKYVVFRQLMTNFWMIPDDRDLEFLGWPRFMKAYL